MKFRRITIFGLTLALAGTLTAFAACTDPENTGETPPEYTFEDGRPDGELTAPDEGFEIDGVLDEAAYSSIKWLEGPVLRPYYTSDGQGVYYDYDVIQERMEDAAQVKMGTYYGENGVYIAYSYQEQAGKVCYVNPSRRSYRNSGVELHIGIPSSVTMTGDETISRLTVNANGALTIAKTQGDIWMAPYGTENHANMPYVGLTGNGTRTDENADRTEYTFELFIPWGYFDEVGGEGTAQNMKDGGDLVVAPGIITVNNYTGTGQTDREYYVLSARLDDGSWYKAQGWYHFNRDGVVAYDISIAQPQNGSVQEWMGYDTAAKNSSLTFVTKANEGYALKEFRVNGVAVPRDYIHYDMYTTLGADAESNVQKAYIKIPEKEITGDISVEAVFEPLASGEQTLVATVYGESTETPLANATVTFTRGVEVKKATTDGNGTLTLSGLTAGLYDVAVNDLTYGKLTDYVFFSPEANAQIVFERNAIALEGSENVASNYGEIYGKVGSLEGGFVFSGFFGFENASYDDLTNFTCTVYFITDKAASEQVGFRFTKWGNYLMLKYENAEYHFESDAEAVKYFKENKGVWFRFSVDAEGNISAYIERTEGDWVLLSTNTSVQFPIEKGLEAITFSKQDDFNASHYAVLKDGELKIGTSDVDIPVTFTVNGGGQVNGGTVSVTEDVNLGEKVTVTLTPDADYIPSLKVDGEPVNCTSGEGGIYTYTFTASKQSYVLEVTFEKVAGAYTVNATIAEALTGAANDLQIVLTNGSSQYTTTKGEGNVWTTESIPYGTYTVIVTSASNEYTVLEQEVTFEEGSNSVTVNITADNYGANRKYVLNGESATENPGVVLAENLGATTNGFVFEGFLGVGGTGDLSNIESKNFASALRFTTESGYQFRLCFYIWNGQNWLVKAFQEGQENTAASHEFGFTGNTVLIDYVKAQNGITVSISAAVNGTLTVYAMTNETDWISLGTWQSPFEIDEKITQVEVLRMFQSGVEGWTAIVDGELRFGISDVDIPVTFTVNDGEQVIGGNVTGTEGVNIGDEVTVTLTPEAGYVFSSLSVDGEPVKCTSGADGVYTYTFTATKSSYSVEVLFGELHDLVITADTMAVPAAANDLSVTLTNAADEAVSLTNESNVWTAHKIPYGSYTLTVTAKTEGYIVLEQEVTFAEGSESVTVNITADNYGENRKYTLKGENTTENPGVVLVENLGATTNGFVFEGFLGVGGSGSLADIGTKNYATALRFTTESGYQFRLCFYIWNGNTWLIKAFQEGKESQSGLSHEFGFSGNTALINYIKEKNGITVSISAAVNGTLTVYAMTNDTVWISLGTWQSPFEIDEKITQVEVLRMFQSGIEGWTAVVDGELRFGTTDTEIKVSFTGTGAVAGGSIEVTDASLGGEVTVTLTPEEGYVFSSLSVDGEPVECTSGADGVYTYTFMATKNSYAFAAMFEQAGGAYTVNATIAETLTGAADDLSIVLSNGSSEYAATKVEGNVWTTESIPYGTYTVIVTSASGGYTVLEQEVTFAEGSESVTVEITADNYGENRKYTLEGESATENGVVITENLGATTDGFVFEGFLGVGGSGSLADIGTKNYATALRFTTESGDQFRLCFYIWNGQYWLVKAFQEGKENQSGLSNEFAFTGNTVLIDYVKAQNGITVSISAAADGTLTVYAKTSDTEWVLIGEWKSPFPVTEKITKVEVLRMFQQGIEGWTATVDGELRFGTTDTGLPAVSVLTETINLDEKGTKYWEHYSSGTGANNGPTVTDGKTNATDIIEFDPSEWDRYETRPYNADNAQAFTGTSQNGELNSKGFVFRDQSKTLTATVTLSKGDTALKVYTGTWISNCQFTFTLSDAEGNVVGSIGFTVTNGSATYETIFFIDTSDWAEDESRQFTLTCGSNNTLKLMAIAIS